MISKLLICVSFNPILHTTVVLKILKQNCRVDILQQMVPIIVSSYNGHWSSFSAIAEHSRHILTKLNFNTKCTYWIQYPICIESWLTCPIFHSMNRFFNWTLHLLIKCYSDLEEQINNYNLLIEKNGVSVSLSMFGEVCLQPNVSRGIKQPGNFFAIIAKVSSPAFLCQFAD